MAESAARWAKALHLASSGKHAARGPRPAAVGTRSQKGPPSPTPTHLHHKLSAAREASLREEHVLWLLLLFRLLDLGQSADGVHPRAAVCAAL